jgi:hypothetical protein
MLQRTSRYDCSFLHRGEMKTKILSALAPMLVLGGCYMSTGASFSMDAGPDAAPDPRLDDAAAEDAAGDRVDPPPPECLAAPLENVTGFDGVGESSPRVAGSAFYDGLRDRVVVYGGLRGSGDYTPDAVAIDLDVITIKLLTYEGTAPLGWTQAGAAYDPAGDRVFVVGGMVRGDFSNRVLEIRNVGEDRLSADRLPELPQYQLRGAAAGYDYEEGRLVIFGGYDGTHTGDGYTDQTLELRPDASSPAWRLLEAAGGPAPQEGASMVFVPGYGLVLVAKENSDYQGDRKVFVMGRGTEAWQEVELDSPWEPGNRPAVFWDPDACRLIVWGGGCTEGGHSVELFYTPAAVTEIAVTAENYFPRVFLNATLDPLRRQFVVQGGYDCNVDVFLSSVEILTFR